ncbi:hypothetical protein BDK51DRAFT_44139 [Blyttiomyces helicus]|uniref:Uncharacterized protein n=1 Tax=Blyttiomyces helicus TaxID=388810 RepID=A0A4P9WKX7_9FUNG|nr:hypothetical protein BDK51DRAFT_44139 [Blyttiomyces helicus]|eukprot:RKO92795.1 hypothetical protein BDK51DRAFT_44139 [Blyttiomyces helicus]
MLIPRVPLQKDQCPPDTWICLKTINKKSNESPEERIIEVKPFANAAPVASLLNNELHLSYPFTGGVRVVNINFVCKKDVVSLACGRRRYVLAILPYDIYPRLAVDLVGQLSRLSRGVYALTTRAAVGE